jgi:hypothetical protein
MHGRPWRLGVALGHREREGGRPPRHYRPRHAGEGGFALVSVVVVAMVIAALAVGLTALVRSAATESAVLRADAEARAGTEAGLNRIILAYARSGDPLRAALAPDGRPIAWEFAGRRLTLRAQAESGKLDLNAADRDHIGAVASRLFAEPEARARVLARIDAARIARERIAAVAAVLTPLDRMTARRDDAEAHFTVMTDQRGVDPATAPLLVLETMPFLSDEARGAIVAARRAGTPIGLDNLGAAARQFVPERPIYTFRAETAAGFDRAGALQAVVSFSERGGFLIHAWALAGIRR